MAVGPFSQDELDEIYAFAIDLGRKAGKMLMGHAEQRISGSDALSQNFKEKDNAVDIVTQTDEGVLTHSNISTETDRKMHRRRSIHSQ